ncbi:Protein NYNRIN [Labeo rohita]|uniref:Protein NYNRIN n=1 Tax=Labeo rohita TaxID=84645 RepID=A0ABQ8L5P2_LABRO|nr:Protein NYNRIN [Labeo rohita]
MGPFPRSMQQNEYLLVIVDYFSKWIEVFLMRAAKDTQFTSNLLDQVCKQWHIIQRLTTAYHPQSNLTESLNLNLKMMMATYVDQNHRTWDQWI